VCPMRMAGIEIRPIVDMTGIHKFNEVFFTDARLPGDALIGEENGGWALAKVTLANERVSLSGGGVLWSDGPTALDLLDAVRKAGGVSDPLMRQKLARVFTEHQILDLLRLRMLTSAVAGRPPGPERPAQSGEIG